MHEKREDTEFENPAAVSFLSRESLLGARVKNITRVRRKESVKQRLGKLLLHTGMLVFALSMYAVTIEPDYLPEMMLKQKETETAEKMITSDNSYVVKSGEGYELYVDGSLFYTFDSRQEIPEEFRALPQKSNIH